MSQQEKIDSLRENNKELLLLVQTKQEMLDMVSNAVKDIKWLVHRGALESELVERLNAQDISHINFDK